MTRSPFLAGLLCLSIAGCCNMKHEGADKEPPAVKVPFDQLPAPVQATLQREAPGVAIASVDKETEHGKTTFEADAVIAGTNYEIKVAESGQLISKAIDNEEKESGTNKKDKD
jgi:hypothetical protein